MLMAKRSFQNSWIPIGLDRTAAAAQTDFFSKIFLWKYSLHEVYSSMIMKCKYARSQHPSREVENYLHHKSPLMLSSGHFPSSFWI